MKIGRLAVLVAICFLAGCNSTSKLTTTSQPSVRAYNGTASVGDFLTISIDATSQTITYQNYTNGENGTVPYTVNADGTYTISDPNGNLLAAYEVPGFVMMIETAKSGPTANTPALVTAIESVPTTINTFAGKSFNYVQFRTAAGGMTVGTISIDGSGNVQHDGYWPFGVFSQSLFNPGTISATGMQEDPSGDFFTIADSGGSNNYAFGTPSGFFAVDTENGTILSLPKARSKAFDPSDSGTYTAIFYKKANAQMGQGNVETGTASEGKATITIDQSGFLTITDRQSKTLATGTLVAIEDATYIYDRTSATLSDPLHGMFTVRMTNNGVQQDVFVSFQGNAVVFSSFQTAQQIHGYAPYTYYYGVGLK